VLANFIGIAAEVAGRPANRLAAWRYRGWPGREQDFELASRMLAD
jgi:hypothetical protein